jgi:hypothetical protein
MSDSTPQGNPDKPIDVDDLEDPNFDGTLNGWDEDPFAYDYGEFINKHPLRSAKELDKCSGTKASNSERNCKPILRRILKTGMP